MKQILTSAFFVFFCVSEVPAATFALKNSGADTVRFKSTAKMEFIEGSTSNVSGSFTFDPANSSSAVSGTIQVDLTTLKTGIEMRDQHMRERHLNTDKFPNAYFELQSVENLPATWKQDSSYSLSSSGFFYIHGVKRKITPSLKVSISGADSTLQVHIDATFSINLDEFEIPRPKALFMKLAETIEVEAKFTGINNLPPAPVTLPSWAEQK